MSAGTQWIRMGRLLRGLIAAATNAPLASPGLRMALPLCGADPRMPERRGERVAETTTEARAGVTGHNVRYVLAVSLIGIIAAFIVIYFLFFG
jgi:hypothetical protein